LYTFYQAKISALAEPDVRNICKSLKKLSFTGFTAAETDSSESLSEGTTLFELYLALHRFVILGKGLCPTEHDSFHIRNFYQWFHGGVAQWLDIAVFKALQRIEKAVELDSLVPVDNTVRYSSSAVDTITIFYQVKVFWQQLNWPDVEGCYTFIAKIIDVSLSHFWEQRFVTAFAGYLSVLRFLRREDGDEGRRNGRQTGRLREKI
jgi:BAI1-associated protein 3